MKIPFQLFRQLPKLKRGISQYQRYWDESLFHNKLYRSLDSLGRSLVEILLRLYYLLRYHYQEISTKDRVMILGALGYFILPVDLLPDIFLGALGFTDDMALALWVLNTINRELPPLVKEQAQQKTETLFSRLARSRRIEKEDNSLVDDTL